ncbi:hypothetical protein [Micromonospora polyrhachis]|uniref:Uncharacterized protein n=1 Tax=Micromonospora polyrhachis TaxID=1282883 RepID=A0A7W7SMV0_9ACTN|nr:hypothetical protein [Micromonospora polyrhachis]MBB4957697.1 hypothetical protein [Micromonospora polyrhachis]
MSEIVRDEPRVRLHYSVPSGTSEGSAAILAAAGGVRIPWQELDIAYFDLVLAAEPTLVSGISGPAIVLGPDPIQQETAGPRGVELPGVELPGAEAPPGHRSTPRSWALAHQRQRDRLRARYSGPALPCVVVGDPTYDRLIASKPMRSDYRTAVKVCAGQNLVLVALAGDPGSWFDRSTKLLRRLSRELPAVKYRLMLLLPSGAGYAPGIRQARARISGADGNRFMLIEPEIDWRSILIAADQVVGEYGTVTGYAAAIGRPVWLTDGPKTGVPGSIAESVLSVASFIDPVVPLCQQIPTSVARRAAGRYEIVDRLTSMPGRSACALRSQIYPLLRLDGPQGRTRYRPVPVPKLE